MNFKILAAFIFSVFSLKAQVIPLAQRVNWNSPGYQGSIPDPALVVNVLEFGAAGDGLTNDFNAVQKAINSLNGNPGVVLFPVGTYLLQSTLNLPSGVILRGESSTKTLLKFTLSSSGYDCIKISANQPSSFISVSSGYTKESSSVVVSDISSFNVGDYAELRQQNGSWDIDPKSYATYCVGQVVKIINIAGNTITFEKPLRIDYSASLNPQIRKINPVKNVGIEYLQIERTNDATPASGGGYNIHFLYAANCWVRSVESNKSIGSHILADVSTHIEITGCYFHDAFTYDGSATRGYGVTLIQHSGECLVENNIFKHLRHSMMVKQGANGNVFGYNYSIEPNRSEQFSDYGGDISLHGHYAFANLFEGNIVQNIHIDQTGGPSGPYNTFFRNRAELYGIWMTAGSVQSDKQNFVGNEVTMAKSCAFYYMGFCYIYKGNYETAGSGHFEYGNNVKLNTTSGSVVPAGTSDLTDRSYYKPFSSTLSIEREPEDEIGLPSALGSSTNDAEDRYETEAIKTYPEPPGSLPIKISSVDVSIDRKSIFLFWTTSKEINNDYFTIEKSADGVNFYPLQKVDGAGTSRSDVSYSIEDQNPLKGKSYYRIRQTDFNGSFSYSQLVSILYNTKDKELVISPNPIRNNNLDFFLMGFDEKEKAVLRVIDIEGKVKISKIIDISLSESSLYSLNFKSKINKGVYFLHIKTYSKNLYKKFIVE